MAVRRKATFCGLFAASLLVSTLAIASPHSSAQASDIVRDGLIIAALGAPAVQGDWDGSGQAALAIGGTFAVTEGLKRAFPEERPDHSNDKSFPSGHTSTSFAAAASLEKRYGWKAGLPAHAVALFVAVARVEANKHFVHDVVVGAAIGEAAGWLITKRRDDRVQWLPWGDAHGGGATLSYRF
ncbi:MAG: phosphatase PAP2 family protein [Sphingomicrobium sp.]